MQDIDKQTGTSLITVASLQIHRCWHPGTSAPLLTQSSPDTGNSPYFAIKASVPKLKDILNTVKNGCQSGNVFMNLSDHCQPTRIMESDLWALGTNKRSILENPTLVPSVLLREIKPIVPNFLTFLIFSCFSLLLSVSLLWSQKCFETV